MTRVDDERARARRRDEGEEGVGALAAEDVASAGPLRAGIVTP